MPIENKTLAQALSSSIQAYRNCLESGNNEWEVKWKSLIESLIDELPHGSGIDTKTLLDFDKSHETKIVLDIGFHHMNQNGFYDGWTYHTITVTPAFEGVNLRISGPNRNDIKDYLYETFDYALTQPSKVWADQYKQTK